MTCFLANMDPESGRLLYVNAGHNPPLVVRTDGSVEHLSEGDLEAAFDLDDALASVDLIYERVLQPAPLSTMTFLCRRKNSTSLSMSLILRNHQKIMRARIL